MKHQKNSIRVNQQSEKKEKATENVDIHKQNTHLGNVNIIKTVKFVLENVLILKKFHASEEIGLLVDVMVALK